MLACIYVSEFLEAIFKWKHRKKKSFFFLILKSHISSIYINKYIRYLILIWHVTVDVCSVIQLKNIPHGAVWLLSINWNLKYVSPFNAYKRK